MAYAPHLSLSLFNTDIKGTHKPLTGYQGTRHVPFVARNKHYSRTTPLQIVANAFGHLPQTALQVQDFLALPEDAVQNVLPPLRFEDFDPATMYDRAELEQLYAVPQSLFRQPAQIPSCLDVAVDELIRMKHPTIKAEPGVLNKLVKGIRSTNPELQFSLLALRAMLNFLPVQSDVLTQIAEEALHSDNITSDVQNLIVGVEQVQLELDVPNILYYPYSATIKPFMDALAGTYYSDDVVFPAVHNHNGQDSFDLDAFLDDYIYHEAPEHVQQNATLPTLYQNYVETLVANFQNGLISTPTQAFIICVFLHAPPIIALPDSHKLHELLRDNLEYLIRNQPPNSELRNPYLAPDVPGLNFNPGDPRPPPHGPGYSRGPDYPQPNLAQPIRPRPEAAGGAIALPTPNGIGFGESIPSARPQTLDLAEPNPALQITPQPEPLPLSDQGFNTSMSRQRQDSVSRLIADIRNVGVMLRDLFALESMQGIVDLDPSSILRNAITDNVDQARRLLTQFASVLSALPPQQRHQLAIAYEPDSFSSDVLDFQHIQNQTSSLASFTPFIETLLMRLKQFALRSTPESLFAALNNILELVGDGVEYAGVAVQDMLMAIDGPAAHLDRIYTRLAQLQAMLSRMSVGHFNPDNLYIPRSIASIPDVHKHNPDQRTNQSLLHNDMFLLRPQQSRPIHENLVENFHRYVAQPLRHIAQLLRNGTSVKDAHRLLEILETTVRKPRSHPIEDAFIIPEQPDYDNAREIQHFFPSMPDYMRRFLPDAPEDQPINPNPTGQRGQTLRGFSLLLPIDDVINDPQIEFFEPPEPVHEDVIEPDFHDLPLVPSSRRDAYPIGQDPNRLHVLESAFTQRILHLDELASLSRAAFRDRQLVPVLNGRSSKRDLQCLLLLIGVSFARAIAAIEYQSQYVIHHTNLQRSVLAPIITHFLQLVQYFRDEGISFSYSDSGIQGFLSNLRRHTLINQVLPQTPPDHPFMLIQYPNLDNLSNDDSFASRDSFLECTHRLQTIIASLRSFADNWSDYQHSPTDPFTIQSFFSWSIPLMQTLVITIEETPNQVNDSSDLIPPKPEHKGIRPKVRTGRTAQFDAAKYHSQDAATRQAKRAKRHDKHHEDEPVRPKRKRRENRSRRPKQRKVRKSPSRRPDTSTEQNDDGPMSAIGSAATPSDNEPESYAQPATGIDHNDITAPLSDADVPFNLPLPAEDILPSADALLSIRDPRTEPERNVIRRRQSLIPMPPPPPQVVDPADNPYPAVTPLYNIANPPQQGPDQFRAYYENLYDHFTRFERFIAFSSGAEHTYAIEAFVYEVLHDTNTIPYYAPSINDLRNNDPIYSHILGPDPVSIELFIDFVADVLAGTRSDTEIRYFSDSYGIYAALPAPNMALDPTIDAPSTLYDNYQSLLFLALQSGQLWGDRYMYNELDELALQISTGPEFEHSYDLLDQIYQHMHNIAPAVEALEDIKYEIDDLLGDDATPADYGDALDDYVDNMELTLEDIPSDLIGDRPQRAHRTHPNFGPTPDIRNPPAPYHNPTSDFRYPLQPRQPTRIVTLADLEPVNPSGNDTTQDLHDTAHRRRGY